MKQIEIARCICGSVPEIRSLLDQNKYFYVFCAGCHRETDSRYTMKRAIKDWNKWMKQLRSVKYPADDADKGGE